MAKKKVKTSKTKGTSSQSKPTRTKKLILRKVEKSDSASWYPVISEKALFRLEAPNEISVISLQDNSMYKLTQLGAYIWTLLDGTRTTQEIISLCADEFGLKAPFSTQIEKFLNSLLAADLVEKSKTKKPLKNIKKNSIKIQLQKKNLTPPRLEQRDKLSALYLLSAGSSN